MRRLLVDSNVALAGDVPVSSFARFRASMATSSEEKAPFHPFGRWDLVVMVGTQDGSGEAARRAGGDA